MEQALQFVMENLENDVNFTEDPNWIYSFARKVSRANKM